MHLLLIAMPLLLVPNSALLEPSIRPVPSMSDSAVMSANIDDDIGHTSTHLLTHPYAQQEANL